MVTKILKMTGMLVASRVSTHTHTHTHTYDEIESTIRHVVSKISRQAH